MTLDRRTTGWLCLALVGVFIVAGWWPFEFHPPNRVGWLDGRPGLHFRPNAIAFEADAKPLLPPATSGSSSASLTIELWLEGEREATDDCDHILVVHDGRFPSPLVLCQWQAELILRVRSASNQRGYAEVGAGDVFMKRQPRFVTITSDASGTAFYLDGVLANRFPQFVLPADALNGELLLGDSAVGKQGWTGNLLGLAIYDHVIGDGEIAGHYRAWTSRQGGGLAGEPGLAALFTFTEGRGEQAADLTHHHRVVFPPVYRVAQKRYLAAPWEDGTLEWPDVGDFILNVLGFVPFGLLMFQYLRKGTRARTGRHAVLTIATGMATSLLIEVVQVWMPARYSSFTDLTLNTLGTVIGVILSVQLSAVSCRRG